jgi:hypothetical protein
MKLTVYPAVGQVQRSSPTKRRQGTIQAIALGFNAEPSGVIGCEESASSYLIRVLVEERPFARSISMTSEFSGLCEIASCPKRRKRTAQTDTTRNPVRTEPFESDPRGDGAPQSLARGR